MSEKCVFVTGADRGLGLALCAGLLNRGWRVFAGQYMPSWPELAQLSAQFPGQMSLIALDVASMPSIQAAAGEIAGQTDHLDMLINNAGVTSPNQPATIFAVQNYAEMERVYNVNTLGPLRVVEAFLPLLSAGSRRLAFVSSEAGSIAASKRTGWFGYCMSKAALNMAVKNLFNELRPQNYTFRLYHPGWMRTYMGGEKNMQATFEPEEAAVPALSYFLSGLEPGSVSYDEDVLILRDNLGQEYPW